MSPLDRLSRNVAVRFLRRGSVATIDTSIRNQINSGLLRVGMDGNHRFRSTGQALSIIAKKLSEFQMEFTYPITTSDTAGESGRLTIDLSMSSEDGFNPTPIRNTSLAFHWTSLDSGFEILAYLG